MQKLVGTSNLGQALAAEADRPLAFGCVECLIMTLRLLDDSANLGCFSLRMGTLTQYMRLDSAASDAVNLFPKADEHFEFGSIFGVLNRCKTAIGTKLLERWLRQPLLDIDEINARLNVVQALKVSVVMVIWG